MVRAAWLAASVALLVACGERPLEPREPTPGVPHYKIQSYNVEAGDHTDPATVKAVGASGADVLVLQETTPQWEVVLRERYGDSYPYQLYQHNLPDAGAAGLAVLARYPIEDGGWHPGLYYPGWHVNVDTPSGTLQILNVHLRAGHTGNGNAVKSYLTSGDDHIAEIKLFLEQCADEMPSLVVGDFNEGVDGSAVEYLQDRGYRNALPLYHPGQFTWRHASVANQFAQTLDHILFDRAFEPLNAWVVDAGHSDHLPVVAHLEAAYEWEPLRRARAEGTIAPE